MGEPETDIVLYTTMLLSTKHYKLTQSFNSHHLIHFDNRTLQRIQAYGQLVTACKILVFDVYSTKCLTSPNKWHENAPI